MGTHQATRLVALFILVAAYLTSTANIQAADSPRPADGTSLVLSAPPRDSEDGGHKRFDPVAEYLAKVLGRKVVYKHPATWGGYQADMQRGVYDLVFDGPHFVGWRIEKIGHHVLVKFPGEFIYTAVVRKEDARYTGMQTLVGRRFCAHPPPNLGTLIMYNEFENPARQPFVIVVDGYKEIYDSLIKKKCDAAMLPLQHAQKFDPKSEYTRIIFQNTPLSQQAFTAGPRISAKERAKIVEALQAPASDVPLARVREDYGLGKNFIPAEDQEYAGLGKYLRGVEGFY